MSRRGFSLIEVVIAMAVMSLGLIAFLKLSQVSTKQQTQSNMTYNADQLRRNLVQHVQNANAWTKTVADVSNVSLTCLRNSTTCTGITGPFRLRDSSDHVVYDPLSSPSNGFTATGAPCNTFDGVNGNDACPFRIDLTWQPVCSGACVNPQVEVIGTMQYKPVAPQRNIAFNAGNYSFDLIRGGGGSGAFTNFAVFDVSGTFTVPAGITTILVEAWGGGGGGGAGTGIDTAPNVGGPDCLGVVVGHPVAPKGRGSSGGGGGYGKQIFTVVPATVYNITIGAGGTAGTAACGAATAGGDTSFDALITATGGGPGLIGCGWNPGGAGGTSTGTLSVQGGPGREAVHALTGGNSPNGGAGATLGNAAAVPGGGGMSGGAVAGGIPNCSVGSTGASGRSVVYW